MSFNDSNLRVCKLLTFTVFTKGANISGGHCTYEMSNARYVNIIKVASVPFIKYFESV
jgi:hypothetical protein